MFNLKNLLEKANGGYQMTREEFRLATDSYAKLRKEYYTKAIKKGFESYIDKFTNEDITDFQWKYGEKYMIEDMIEDMN